MRGWTVGGALLQGSSGVLLVQNRRRGGAVDWTPPGGVIEVTDGESLLDGLAREVVEETGLRVTRWLGPVWTVHADAPDLGWSLTAEVHRADAWEGVLAPADPDGIVVDARFVLAGECAALLAGGHPWVGEPLAAWLAAPWDDARAFAYRVDGDDPRTATVTRTA